MMFLIQSVLKNHKVKMTIVNQIAAQYHKVSHVIFDMDGLLLGKLMRKKKSVV